MIFLTATFCPVRLSLAELEIVGRPNQPAVSSQRHFRGIYRMHTKRDQMRPFPPVGDQNICATPQNQHRGQRLIDMAVVASALGYPAYLEVISKVVPKICARTNSAMLAVDLAARIEGRRWEWKYVCKNIDGVQYGGCFR